MMKKFSVFLCTLAIIFGVAGLASANLIVNGDFEGGSFNPWQTNGDMTLATAGIFAGIQGMDGHYALFGFDSGNDTSTLRQDFDLTGASEIRVQFDWAFDYLDLNFRADDRFASILREGNPDPVVSIPLLNLSSGFIGLDYGHFDQTFLISGGSTDGRLIFQLNEADGCLLYSAAGIDNVDINPVPEPATMLLLGSGLAGLAGFGRKKFFKKK